MLKPDRGSQRVNRRVVLKGLGASLTLPWVESLARAAEGDLPGEPSPAPTRFVATFFPLGVNTEKWGVEGDGDSLQFKPTLQPLGAIKNKVTVLDKVAHPHLRGVRGHAGKVAAVLTGEPGGRKGNASGISIDQVIAERIGDRTDLRSLALGISPARMGRGFYDSNISWRGPDKPLAKEVDPRGAFQMLFGDCSWLKRDRSVLDFVLQQARQLHSRLSAQDRQTLAEYFDGIRELELRIDRLQQHRGQWTQEMMLSEPSLRFHPDDPSGAGEFADFALFPPEDFREHTRLMLELMVLALRMDKTRVISFMFDSYGPKYMDFSFIPGVTGQWHALSHHRRAAGLMHQYHLINQWHVSQYTWFLRRLDEIREGEGTLLDHALVMLVSDMWDGNTHNCVQYPLILGGSAGGRIRTGRRVAIENGSMSRLFLTLAELMGTPLDQLREAHESYTSMLTA